MLKVDVFKSWTMWLRILKVDGILLLKKISYVAFRNVDKFVLFLKNYFDLRQVLNSRTRAGGCAGN